MDQELPILLTYQNCSDCDSCLLTGENFTSLLLWGSIFSITTKLCDHFSYQPWPTEESHQNFCPVYFYQCFPDGLSKQINALGILQNIILSWVDLSLVIYFFLQGHFSESFLTPFQDNSGVFTLLCVNNCFLLISESYFCIESDCSIPSLKSASKSDFFNQSWIGPHALLSSTIKIQSQECYTGPCWYMLPNSCASFAIYIHSCWNFA